jgi:hypothetical protein
MRKSLPKTLPGKGEKYVRLLPRNLEENSNLN